MSLIPEAFSDNSHTDIAVFIYSHLCENETLFFIGVEEVDIGQRNARRRGEYKCFETVFINEFYFWYVYSFSHLSRMGPDRNGFRDRMFGREPYPPPPPPPFLRDRMMGRFGVRVSFCSMNSFYDAVVAMSNKSEFVLM